MSPRPKAEAPSAQTVDLLVIGGGANGCAIARDAAGRGLSVTLCEMGDLAGATSSASTKLIHGGLRYLEHYAFRLVRESLAEREVLLAAAPHIIYPLRFVLPHHKGLRPMWLLRMGLFLYDHIGGRRTLPGTRTLSLAGTAEGAPLKSRFRRGFAYSDAWTDDARMVTLAALDASERGARILTHTRLLSARREGATWRAVLQHADGVSEEVTARALVNAAGPWVEQVARLAGQNRPARSVKLVKGSHIVLPKIYEGAHAYTLQGADGRVIFTIPYEGRFTLVGTTDVPQTGEPGPAAASREEIAYLCGALEGYFDRKVSPADVVWTYAGVRPLHDDGHENASAVTRDYVLDLEAPEGAAPLLSIHGGKITTFRKLGEHALELLKPKLGFTAGPWTKRAKLPGGELGGSFDGFRSDIALTHPWLEEPHLTRLCRAYGSRLADVLGEAQGWADLGETFGAGLTEREAAYLKRVEWARSPEDVLWRRSKLGLHMTPAERDRFARAFPAL